jgi:hypothetical protein
MSRNHALALVACLAFAAGGAAQRFEEKVSVREVELVFELPDLPRLRTGIFGPEDLTVIEDGLIRPVTKVGSIEDGTVRSRFRRDEAFDAPPWTAVVWIDRALASPETVFAATLGLALHAAELTGLGTVEVVDTSVLLPPTREARRLEMVLADLAGQARVERDRAESNPVPTRARPGEPRPDAATLRRQLDRLLVHLAGRREPGPRLLFLVSDGFNVTPGEMKAFESGIGGMASPGSGERAAAILDAARLLAAYGWVTVALPMRRQDPGREDRSPNDGDRFRHNTGGWGPVNNSVPPMIPPKRPKDTRLKWPAAVDALIQPDLSPLRALTGPTAGTFVAVDALLPSTLESLAGRWHLYYQTQMPADGRLRPVEVRLRNGTAVRTRQWVRSSTPEGIAEARLRRLLAGDRLPEGTPEFPLRIETGKINVGAFSAPEPAVPGPVRISTAYAGADGALTIRHELAPGIDSPDKGWSGTLTGLDGARPLAVLVEDLARERWSAVRTDGEGRVAEIRHDIAVGGGRVEHRRPAGPRWTW